MKRLGWMHGTTHVTCSTQATAGPSIVLEPTEFLDLLRDESSDQLIIVSTKAAWWYPYHKYMMKFEGMRVYTTSKEELRLPKYIRMIRAKTIHHPGLYI